MKLGSIRGIIGAEQIQRIAVHTSSCKGIQRLFGMLILSEQTNNGAGGHC